MSQFIRNEGEKNYSVPIVILLFIAMFSGGIYYYLSINSRTVSPFPPKPSFVVVFYTPTPEMELTPTSSPSATPSPKKTQAVPTKSVIASITATPKLSPKPTVSPTEKPK